MAGLAAVLSDTKKKDIKVKELLSLITDNIAHRGKKTKIIKGVNGIKNGFACLLSNYNLKPESIGNNDASFTFIDGKIYNLGSLLKSQSIACIEKNAGDSHKFSLLFKKMGTKLFPLLEGSFAVLHADSEGNVYALRDFIGRKPLYFAVNSKENLIMIGSEVKVFKDIGKDFVIQELYPGNYIKNNDIQIDFKKLDSKEFSPNDDISLKDSVESIDRFLNKAIEKRLSNESCKYGVWLSGGLDSSIIAAIMKNHKNEVYTYSVGFDKSPDIIYSRKVAEYIDSNHHEYNLDIDEIFKIIPEVIYTLESFDAPLVRSSIGNLIVSKISSESDIIFSGEGGDEVFAGYNYFLDLDSSDSVQDELYNAINSLHNTALQRVDRFANRYSIDVKLPLLDEQLVDYSLGVPVELKVDKKNKATKNVLRKVAEKYLPEDVVWRGKDKFWEGSGIYDKLNDKIDKIITDKEFEDNSLLENGFRLRNKEEYYYYKTFKSFFPDMDYSKFLSFTEDFN
ncbi:MAG: asparagine synthase-related protein [Actinomycetota bacterium]|nr:asparagine synthase-related protein [Actinomycetota bacterium]